MSVTEQRQFSEEEIEEILDMRAPENPLSMKGVTDAIREEPILFAGLIFALGLLVGVSLHPSRRK